MFDLHRNLQPFVTLYLVGVLLAGCEAATVTPTNLKPGLGPRLGDAVEVGAKQTAAQVAEQIVDYYKRRGWIEVTRPRVRLMGP